MPVAVFLLSAAVVLYVLFLYPLLVALTSRYRSRPIRRDDRERTVSIVMPVRNGALWLKPKIESILALDYPPALIEMVVVFDGCIDHSEAVLHQFNDSRIRTISLPSTGKPGALNAAIEIASGELLFFTDVRQRLAPDCLRKLVACFGDPEVGVVSGELVILRGESKEEEAVGAYWRYEKWIRMHVSAIHSFPGATGCIYAMRRQLAVPLPSTTLLDDVYQPLNAFFRGYRIIFEPGAIAYDSPASLSAEFRRKVRTLAGVYQTVGQFPRILLPGHPLWIHFLSHKLGRLLLPYALLAATISSFWLPGIWGIVIPAAQALFYLMALLDWWIPPSALLKRATSPIRTFVVLMVASACAVSIFFVPPSSLWKETRIRARSAQE